MKINKTIWKCPECGSYSIWGNGDGNYNEDIIENWWEELFCSDCDSSFTNPDEEVIVPEIKNNDDLHWLSDKYTIDGFVLYNMENNKWKGIVQIPVISPIHRQIMNTDRCIVYVTNEYAYRTDARIALYELLNTLIKQINELNNE